MNHLKTKEIVAITGVNEKTLHYWDRTGLVSPSVQAGRGRGTIKIYAFKDAVAVAAAVQLRRAGINGNALRRVVNYIKRRPGLRTVTSRSILVLDGRRVREINYHECDGSPSDLIFSYAVALDLLKVVTHVRTAL